MESIKDILSRLCEYYEVPNNRQLSDKIGVNYNTISTWIKRESIPYEKLHSIAHNESISFDWLLFGKKSSEKNHSNTVIGNNNITTGGGSINGNININTSKFNHKDDVIEIIELLEYAPSGFLTIVKDKLLAFKKMSEF